MTVVGDSLIRAAKEAAAIARGKLKPHVFIPDQHGNCCCSYCVPIKPLKIVAPDREP